MILLTSILEAKVTIFSYSVFQLDRNVELLGVAVRIHYHPLPELVSQRGSSFLLWEINEEYPAASFQIFSLGHMFHLIPSVVSSAYCVIFRRHLPEGLTLWIGGCNLQ